MIDLTFVHEERSTRYEIFVKEYKVEEIGGSVFLIAVPNFHFSMLTPTPERSAYKLQEQPQITETDALIIENAIRQKLSETVGLS